MFRDDNNNSSKNNNNKTQFPETKKDFAPIVDAYDFFRKNSNEYDANKTVLIEQLNPLLKENMSILDFGGGNGELLHDIYQKTNLHKCKPRLSLIEPVSEYQQTATKKFKSTDASFVIYESLEKCPDKSIDVLLVNHVLYYVKDLESVILNLLQKLSPNGSLFVILANENNALIKLWEKFFSKMEMKIPYFLTKDLRLIARNKPIKYNETANIHSLFKFENTKENRSKVARFLLGEYANKISDEVIQENLAQYQKGSEVELPLEDSLFVFKP